jgi:hypothetical protein
MKDVRFFDPDSHEVKSARHADYDEAMNDVADSPSKARLVRFTQRGEPFPGKAVLLELLDLDVAESPFRDLCTLSVPVADEDSDLIFTSSNCSHRLRTYLSALQPRTSAALFSLSSKPLTLTADFDACEAAGDPSNSFSLPRLALMLSTLVAYPVSSDVSAQADLDSSYRFEGGEFCICVY